MNSTGLLSWAGSESAAGQQQAQIVQAVAAESCSVVTVSLLTWVLKAGRLLSQRGGGAAITQGGRPSAQCAASV